MIEAHGGCHCKAVRFSARLRDPPVPALDCNCSICAKIGFIHIIVPHVDFTLESGADSLSSYRFATGMAEHLFCSICGVKSFYQPRSHPDAWSLNAYCLDRRPELAIEFFDGREWEKARQQFD
ncbi:MAG: GFA family protein [Hyphomicrobium sp.]|nr:GFA family protein [Hyphomicrobium sp.]